jgi:chromosome segregation ATPase
MNYQDIEKAEKVLTKLTDTFRAVQYLNDVLETLKPLVGGTAQLEAKLEATKAELATVEGVLGKARQELAEARIEKEKIDQAVAAINGQLKGVGL